VLLDKMREVSILRQDDGICFARGLEDGVLTWMSPNVARRRRVQLMTPTLHAFSVLTWMSPNVARRRRVQLMTPTGSNIKAQPEWLG